MVFDVCVFLIYGKNVCVCVPQQCAPHPVPMEAPVCAGTSVCVLLDGREQAATQVMLPLKVNETTPVHCETVSLNTQGLVFIDRIALKAS